MLILRDKIKKSKNNSYFLVAGIPSLLQQYQLLETEKQTTHEHMMLGLNKGLEISSISSTQDFGVFLTEFRYNLTIFRVVVTMVTGQGEVHLIPANNRNGSSSNTWSSLSS